MTTNKEKKDYCAPGRYDSKHSTCFSVEQLVEMAGAFNRYVTKMGLGVGGGDRFDANDTKFIQIKRDKPYLLTELHKRFQNVCRNNDMCLTQQKFMNEIVREMYVDILKNTFRPEGPDYKTEWLSTQNIEEILGQYEHIVPEFEFLGAVPLDCDKLSFCSLYNIDYDQYLSRGINKLGVVFNHDKYGQSGSHWVALYLDLNKPAVYFADSMAGKPFGNMLHVINKFEEYCKKRNKGVPEKKINTHKYQRDKSECGVYSCNFIIRLLSGESFDDIVENPLKFQEINSCRDVYFSNNESHNSMKPHRGCDPLSLK